MRAETAAAVLGGMSAGTLVVLSGAALGAGYGLWVALVFGAGAVPGAMAKADRELGLGESPLPPSLAFGAAMLASAALAALALGGEGDPSFTLGAMTVLAGAAVGWVFLRFD